MPDRKNVTLRAESTEKEYEVSMADVSTCEGNHEQHAVEKIPHSRLGVASFVLSVTLFLMFCLAVVWALSEINGNAGEEAAILLGVFSLILSLLCLLPLALGLAGILEPGTRKTFAVLGICLVIVMITIIVIGFSIA